MADPETTDPFNYPVTDLDYFVRLANSLKRSFNDSFAAEQQRQHERFVDLCEAHDPY